MNNTNTFKDCVIGDEMPIPCLHLFITLCIMLFEMV